MQSTTPEMKPHPWQADWLATHRSFLNRARAGPIDLLFIGDSITQGWAEDGRAVWEKTFAPLGAANFGIGGDETQNLLWRLDHGEVDGLRPQAVVLLIGTNNLGNSGHSPAQTTAGVFAVVDSLRQKLPAAELLLMAIFPRETHPDAPLRRAVAEVNQSLKPLAGRATLLDIGDQFLAPDGTLPARLLPDALHLSQAGYQIWADAIGPNIGRRLEAK